MYLPKSNYLHASRMLRNSNLRDSRRTIIWPTIENNEIENQVISPVESPIHFIEHEDPSSKALCMKTGSGRDKKNPTDAPRRSTRIASPTDKSPTME